MAKLEVKKLVSHLDQLQRKIDRKNNRVLFRTGGLARKVVQRSMRPGGKKGKKSAPGEPPRYHTKLLRRGIRFEVDKPRGSVIIFAVALQDLGTIRGTGRHAHGAELLEFGGRGVMRVTKRRKSGSDKVQTKRVKIEPRPYLRRTEHVRQYHSFMRNLMRTVPLR